MKNTLIHDIIVKEFLNGNTKIRDLIESAAYTVMKEGGNTDDVLDCVAAFLIEKAITDYKAHRDYIEDVIDDINEYEKKFYAKEAAAAAPATEKAMDKDIPWSLE